MFSGTSLTLKDAWGEKALRRSGYLPVVVMVVALTAASAQPGSGNSLFARAPLLNDSDTATADIPDEPPPAIATADFNHDGIADLVETTSSDGRNSSSHFLAVRLGKPDGTFVSLPSQNVIGSDPRALVVGDFNGDGNPDVIVGDADGTLLEFLGDGKGNMIPAGHVATVGSVASIAIGRFTHDGSVDLVVSDVQSNSAVIFLGAKNGSFHQAWSFPLPRRGMEFHIATADFNKDGVSDLVITNEDNEDYEVMLGNGNGTFTYSPKLSHLRDPYSYCPT